MVTVAFVIYCSFSIFLFQLLEDKQQKICYIKLENQNAPSHLRTHCRIIKPHLTHFNNMFLNKTYMKENFYHQMPFYNLSLPTLSYNSQFYVDNKTQFHRTQKQMTESQIPMCLVQDENGKLHQLIYTLPINEYNTCLRAITNKPKDKKKRKISGKEENCSHSRSKTTKKQIKSNIEVRSKAVASETKNTDNSVTRSSLTGSSTVKKPPIKKDSENLKDLTCKSFETNLKMTSSSGKALLQNKNAQNKYKKGNLETYHSDSSSSESEIVTQELLELNSPNDTTQNGSSSLYEPYSEKSEVSEISSRSVTPLSSSSSYGGERTENPLSVENPSIQSDITNDSLDDILSYPSALNSAKNMTTEDENETNGFGFLNQLEFEDLYKDIPDLMGNNLYLEQSALDRMDSDFLCSENYFDIRNDLYGNESLDLKKFEEDSFFN